MLEQFDNWIRNLGPWGFIALALAALLEYVVPPFPGDTIVLLGGVYVVRGAQPWFWVLLSVTGGSVLGAGLVYGAGRYLARYLEHHPERALPFGIQRQTVLDLQAQLRARGTWLLLSNRFLPMGRSVLFIAAGAAKLPLGRTLLLGTASAFAWNLLILGAGIAVGGNLARLQEWLRTYQRGALGLLGLAVVALGVRWWVRRRRASLPSA